MNEAVLHELARRGIEVVPSTYHERHVLLQHWKRRGYGIHVLREDLHTFDRWVEQNVRWLESHVHHHNLTLEQSLFGTRGY